MQQQQPAARTATAEAIKSYAEAQAGDRAGKMHHAVQAGVLSAYVAFLCDERDQLLRQIKRLTTPNSSDSLIQLSLDDAEVTVEYTFSAGRPGRYSGPPEDCYEDEPDELEIHRVWVNGSWIDPYVFSQDVIDRWGEQITEYCHDRIRADADEAAIARAEAMREYA